MGTMPDKDIAAMTGSTAAIVGNYRRKYAIAAYEGYKFGKDQSPPGRKAGKRGGAGKGKKDAAAAAPSEGPKTRKRRSKLDGLTSEIGKIPDSLIAERAGVSVQNVRLYRRKHGIPLDPSADQRRTAAGSDGGSPRAASVATTDAASAGRSSNLDPFRDQLGAVPDSEIAALADVSEEDVREYRRQHGIKAPADGEKRGRKARSGGRGASRGGLQGYAVSIEAGGETREHILLAADITAAAARASEALDAGELAGEIVSVRLLGPGLG